MPDAGAVFLDVHSAPEPEEASEWIKYLFFMLAGVAIGIFGYFVLVRFFHIRLF